MSETIIVLKKIERQLILYKYFSSPCIKENCDLEKHYGIPTSTIYKDKKDIYDAVYNKSYDEHKDKPTRVRHINRLRRLIWCLDNLNNDPTVYEYVYDDPFDSHNDAHTVVFDMGKKSCKDYYFERYPELSISTMQRDFRLLTRIGYPIRYNPVLQKYDFYEESFDGDYPYVAGVFYDNEKRRLCRRCGEYYDNELQENYEAAIIGMRSGRPVEEWEPY